MWQGVGGACGRVWEHVWQGSGRVSGHVAGVDVCGRGSAYIDGDVWQGVGACGSVPHAPTPCHMLPHVFH